MYPINRFTTILQHTKVIDVVVVNRTANSTICLQDVQPKSIDLANGLHIIHPLYTLCLPKYDLEDLTVKRAVFSCGDLRVAFLFNT